MMRLEGFEPPTRGLEGRRSSAELQAPAEKRSPGIYRAPKSAVTSVTSRPPKVRGAARACTAPRPISRHTGLSRFSRWPELCIHRFTACAALR